MRNILPKSESLKSKKLIRLLFESGNSEFVYPFRILYQKLDSKEKHPALHMISVSKRKIRTAVARNKVKRLFREAYRQQKHPLTELLIEKHLYISIAFIFVGKADISYDLMEEKMKSAIQMLIHKFENE